MLVSGQGFTFDPKEKTTENQLLRVKQATVLTEVCVCPRALTNHYIFRTLLILIALLLGLHV